MPKLGKTDKSKSAAAAAKKKAALKARIEKLNAKVKATRDKAKESCAVAKEKAAVKIEVIKSKISDLRHTGGSVKTKKTQKWVAPFAASQQFY